MAGDDERVVHRWAAGTGNTVVEVSGGLALVRRGRGPDPVEALPREQRPGHRLWIYTNFHCNLACDYCCVSSSPGAARRVLPIDNNRRLLREAAAAGVAEVLFTGGEPFLLPDVVERAHASLDLALPTTILTNAMLWTGARLALLESMSRDVVLQVSLDDADETAHDRHRGPGSFRRTLAGIQTATALGFTVHVAATRQPGADDPRARLEAALAAVGARSGHVLVRQLAALGESSSGVRLSRASLLPEITVSADGVWWHPVAVGDPAMKVADHPFPFAARVELVRDEFRRHRLRRDELATAFPCA